MDFNRIKLISMLTKKLLFIGAFIVCALTTFDGLAQTVEETVNDTVKSAIEEVESEVKSKRKDKKSKRNKRKSKKESVSEKESEEVKTQETATNPETVEKTKPAEQSGKSSERDQKEGGETPANGDRTQAYLEEFKKLDVSYIGSTQNCVGYNVYAIKYKRTWFLATNVNESPVLSVFVERPPRTEDVFPVASPFLVEGLKGILVNKYSKKKNRRKKVKDLQLYGFYKLKRPGRQAAKGLLLIEYPKELNKEPDFFIFKFFYDMFNKKKEEVKPDPNIQKQFEDKLKAPMEKAQEEVSTAIK